MTQFKNLWIDALEVRDLWWYDSNTSESIQTLKKWVWLSFIYVNNAHDTKES